MTTIPLNSPSWLVLSKILCEPVFIILKVAQTKNFALVFQGRILHILQDQ